MEAQDLLNTETGTKETIRLKPEIVKIVKVSIEEVGEKKNKKFVFYCKHPQKEELICISSIKYESPKGKLEVVGSWVDLDEDKKIRKGSATALLLASLGVNTLIETQGKEINTIADDKGYLCLKVY